MYTPCITNQCTVQHITRRYSVSKEVVMYTKCMSCHMLCAYSYSAILVHQYKAKVVSSYIVDFLSDYQFIQKLGYDWTQTLLVPSKWQTISINSCKCILLKFLHFSFAMLSVLVKSDNHHLNTSYPTLVKVQNCTCLYTCTQHWEQHSYPQLIPPGWLHMNTLWHKIKLVQIWYTKCCNEKHCRDYWKEYLQICAADCVSLYIYNMNNRSSNFFKIRLK